MSKICNNHLVNIRKAVDAKGMGHLVAKTEETAKMRAGMWLAGNCPAEQFDPFVVSILEIHQKGREVFGPLPHEGCPLCAAEQIIQRKADNEWIDNCTDAMVVVAKVNGLIA